jgi:trehalose synthase
VQRVLVDAVPLTVLEPVLGRDRFHAFADLAEHARTTLAGRAVVNVNSTATGGGVAEMLPTLLSYARSVEIDARWLVIRGNPDFFAVTKRVHNHIYGVAGDGGALGAAERATYEKTLADQGSDLVSLLGRRDVVVLHDPQTLGLAPAVKQAGLPVIWRCHIGADRTSEWTEDGWRFLAPYLDDVDVVVVSRDSFAPPGCSGDRVVSIPPSIDPLAVKNAPLNVAEITSLLAETGIVGERAGTGAIFQRRDSTTEHVEWMADVVREGPPPSFDTPLVVQVSRWDGLKDMGGVLTAFVEHVDPATGSHLMLVGPSVTGVTDDPEGLAVYQECERQWRELPSEQRSRVHLVTLPTDDVDQNAAVVNALQRHAEVVTQKSLAEGFGLTVVEAMWKATPVVATAVGGIADQIVDGESGLLIRDPTDLAGFGAAVEELLCDPSRAAAMGAAAQQRARDFLPDVHLAKWAELLTRVATRT